MAPVPHIDWLPVAKSALIFSVEGLVAFRLLRMVSRKLGWLRSWTTATTGIGGLAISFAVGASWTLVAVFAGASSDTIEVLAGLGLAYVLDDIACLVWQNSSGRVQR